jgi:hypothetical protein
MNQNEKLLRRSVGAYGKERLSEQQQIDVLIQLLEYAKAKSEQGVYKTISDAQLQLQKQTEIKQAIMIANRLVAELENNEKAQSTLSFLRQKGFYRMLYHYPKFKGQDLPKNDILRQLLLNGFVGVGISLLIVAAFVASALLSAPAWLIAITCGLFVGATAYVSGLLYGVVNDLFATQANLPYFLLGHQPQQKSLLRTNDKVAQGVAWGVSASFGPVVIASIVFAIAVTITAFIMAFAAHIAIPVATFITPALLIAMPLIAVGAEWYARIKTKEYADKLSTIYVGSNSYQMKGLDLMSPTKVEKAAWRANSDRNMFGFTKVPFIGLAGLLTIITLSAVSMFLPSVLIASPIIAVIVPASVVGGGALLLAGLGAYTYFNQDRQVDDRCKLEFERDNIIYDIYTEEDSVYVQQLLNERNLEKEKHQGEKNDGKADNYHSLFKPHTSVNTPQAAEEREEHSEYSFG